MITINPFPIFIYGTTISNLSFSAVKKIFPVGKTTFMKKIGEAMLERGFDVEYFPCSSDPNSLDGMAIPQIGVALLDGTAPHVVDPKTPGAVDEIINLGEYWDEGLMRANKANILDVSRRISRNFKIAYSLLKEARVAYEEWSGYVEESLDLGKWNGLVAELKEKIFAGAVPDYTKPAKVRHLFASAITPNGLMNHINTLLNEEMNIYVLKGTPGTGVQDVIGKIAGRATELGLDTEQFHCPFMPEKMDLLIIPSLKTAVVNTTQPDHRDITLIIGLNIKEEHDLSTLMRQDMLDEYIPELKDAKERYLSLLDKAIAHIKKAKALHDDMETYYVPAMDFEEINQKQREILKRILQYALVYQY